MILIFEKLLGKNHANLLILSIRTIKDILKFRSEKYIHSQIKINNNFIFIIFTFLHFNVN